MRNPYKKFQNSSIHGSKIMLCIKKRDEGTEGRTDGRTDEQPRSNLPPNFCEVGAIIMYIHVNPRFITRVLQKVLSLGSDSFSATFYQTYSYYKPSKYSPVTETHFATFLPSREKQINSLLLVSVLFVCVEVLRPRQPNGVISSAVSLPQHTFTGQA